VSTPRRVELGGPVNFRDIGGYTIEGGGMVARGRVFRSDSLHHLTEEDGPRLHDLGINSAIDFRANDELVEVGIGRLGELDIRHVHLPTTDKVLFRDRAPDWEPPSSAAELYLTMLDTGGAAYAEALRTLVTPGTLPAVYFCMAGKDRTGLFSAVVLGLLGVGDDDIVADYALTHEVVDQIHARHTGDLSEDVRDVRKHLPPDMLGAHTGTMEGTVVGLRERWGSWDGYTDAMGVAPEVVAALRAELVTEAEPT
jgi:protein tyrosine/serine phosphatase